MCLSIRARNGPGRLFENDPARSLITRVINDTRERYHRTNRDTRGLLGLASLIYSSTLNFRIAADRDGTPADKSGATSLVVVALTTGLVDYEIPARDEI